MQHKHKNMIPYKWHNILLCNFPDTNYNMTCSIQYCMSRYNLYILFCRSQNTHPHNLLYIPCNSSLCIHCHTNPYILYSIHPNNLIHNPLYSLLHTTFCIQIYMLTNKNCYSLNTCF